MASLHGVFTESEVAMDGITDSGAQSIQAVNEILQAVTKESTDQAVKLMKATSEAFMVINTHLIIVLPSWNF